MAGPDDRPPVELVPPDITPYAAGNTGIPYVHRFDSGLPGPATLIVALTHGNEISGAIALDALLRQGVRPRVGSLTLAFANVEAYRRFDPAQPEASRSVDEDLNRLWDRETLDGPRDSCELRRARALRSVVDRADLMLDLHSMQTPSPALTLAGMTEKGRALATALGLPDWVVMDRGHAAGRRMRDYGPFADPEAPHTALLVECGQHWAAPTGQMALDVTWRFLALTGQVGPGDAAIPAPAPAAQQVVEVTAAITCTTDRFRFTAPYRGMERVAEADTIIAWDGDAPVRTPYADCILVMPSHRVSPGQTAVRLGRCIG